MVLRQSLAAVFGDSASASAALEAAGIPPTARGEQLSAEQFIELARTP